jgi:PAS domain S-box-containing protein
MAKAKQSAEGELERLRFALDFSEIGDWTWDAATDRVVLSPFACEHFGLEPGAIPTWTEMQNNLLHPDDAPKAAAAVVTSIENKTHYAIEYRARRPKDGAERWILARGRAQYGADGQPTGMIGSVQDITQRKQEQTRLDEEAQALEILNTTGALIASELNLERTVQAVTDAGVAITGAQFGAFFYNVLNAAGESYMLYTLSGVPREEFSKFPMPRNTEVFAPTFGGEGVVRSDDITKDPRYGKMDPHRGMPKGHLPVRSYLAVPVTSRSGEVIGGLFFGHSERAVFSQRDERVMSGVASQAAIAIDNANIYRRAERDLEERERAETALRVLTDELEQRVRVRTAELEAANARLKREAEERERAEEALRQAQKIEAVGQLTGGIAHDFNNLLTIIIGSLESIRRRLGQEGDPKILRSVENGLEGGRRAAGLTQRLLAFARRQPLDPKPNDPNKLLQSMSELLHRTLGEGIEIETVLGAGVWQVEVDAPQLESALLNLALNARDAMEGAGKLTIESANAHVDDAYARTHGVEPGQYVVICVSDTGAGMSAETLERAFEPFFTTKALGHGTGLGLSQVYGFMRQSGGNVRIYSEVGQGTTVKLYLRRFLGEAEREAETQTRTIAGADGGELVLVVEDDPGVRRMSVSLFEELGYRVLEAGDGQAGLEVLERNSDVKLLFTDVGLPKMNGRQLADAARRLYPELKVLFTTGYAKNAIVHHGRLDPGVALLVKPYSFADLAEKVRTVLDS